jgi:hypothetical protein
MLRRPISSRRSLQSVADEVPHNILGRRCFQLLVILIVLTVFLHVLALYGTLTPTTTRVSNKTRTGKYSTTRPCTVQTNKPACAWVGCQPPVLISNLSVYLIYCNRPKQQLVVLMTRAAITSLWTFTHV